MFVHLFISFYCTVIISVVLLIRVCNYIAHAINRYLRFVSRLLVSSFLHRWKLEKLKVIFFAKLCSQREACKDYTYSPTTELPDPKAQIQGCSAGTVKLANPH